jgi:hypothetical protein
MIKKIVYLLGFIFSVLSGAFSLFMGDKFFRLIGFVDVSTGLFWLWTILITVSVGLSMWSFVFFVLDLREKRKVLGSSLIDVPKPVLEEPVPPVPKDEYFRVWDESLQRHVTCVKKGLLLVSMVDGKIFSLDGVLIGRSGSHG